MTFRERVASNRRMQHRKLMIRTKKAATCIALIGVMLITVGNGDTMHATDGERVETTYTVKAGDTLRDISETYLPKNTAGRRYILEFEQGIVELNPWIKENGYTIHPGDRIRVNYWVKKEDKHEKSD